MTSRKTFLKGIAAAGGMGLFGGCRILGDPEVGLTYRGWREGEMDLHFVFTGCGENTFFQLPDGTTILCDTGDYYRPQESFLMPKLPSSDLLGGEWMLRYMRYACGELSPYGEKAVDYAVFTHWHSDHIGHAEFDGCDSRESGFRFRKTKDGRKINGFLSVAEHFSFRRYLDHQYPARNAYGTADTSVDLLGPWIDAQRRNGLEAEAFRPGALDQIALMRNPKRYAADFHIRNICANGVLWDGRGGVRDYAAEHVRATGKNGISQNLLSLGFVIEYGKFRFFTGGDVSGTLTGTDGSAIDYEALVGERVGPVNVCKMNHHGCDNAMHDGFVKAVRAQTYVAPMWCPWQACPEVLARLVRFGSFDGSDPLLLLNSVGRFQKDGEAEGGYELAPLGQYHVVIKVFPGGERYRAYLLDPRDEDRRVVATYDRIS